MITQSCPNCQRTHDISVYVSGQRLLCRCGIRFEVRRNMPSMVGHRPTVGELPAVQAAASGALAGGVARDGAAVAAASPGGGVSSPQEAIPTMPGGGVQPPSRPLMVDLDVSSATVVRGSQAAEEAEAGGDVGRNGTVVSRGKVELPGYEVLELLGQGGMGEVWLARQQSLARTVAVKLLPARLAKDPEFVTRFEKEATALAALSHPNIIQIIDRGVAGEENYYFVMEYVEGRSLRDMLGVNRLSPQQGLRILLQVARAIEYAHEKGIIHRDLKPENILVDAKGHAKVADFGLAGIRRPDSRLNLTGTAVAMGTVNYMAPEQRRDARSVDGRADLFSLGVVIYEVLTGELPMGRFRMPSERVPGLDPRVDEVVARLLENEPDARYATAGEVCVALEEVLGSGSGPALGTGSAPGAKSARASMARSVAKRLHMGWKSAWTGLSVVGGLIGLAYVVRAVIGPVDLHVGGDNRGVVIGTSGIAVKHGKKPWPPNTDGELFATADVEEAKQPDGLLRLKLEFIPGEEELNAWSGAWRLEGGKLQVLQGGSEVGPKGRFLPRTYVAHRYFSSDDFTAEVEMDVKKLGSDYLDEPDAQHFGELTFRIKDLQVSAFAIPDVGMRLSWRYLLEDGEEVVGNSSQDLENLTADEMPVPTKGPFKVRLQLKRKKNGVMAEAYVNNVRFAYKMLHGLEGRAGKVALGCRNLACGFSHLMVQGIAVERPKKKVAGSAQE